MKLFFVIYKNVCIFNEIFYTPENIKKVHNTFQIGRIYAPYWYFRCIYKRVIGNLNAQKSRQQLT
jgi:hypothetical protein